MPWQHETRWTLAKVMLCCLMAPSQVRNQCWLAISTVPWHSSESIIIRSEYIKMCEMIFEKKKNIFKINSRSSLLNYAVNGSFVSRQLSVARFQRIRHLIGGFMWTCFFFPDEDGQSWVQVSHRLCWGCACHFHQLLSLQPAWKWRGHDGQEVTGMMVRGWPWLLANGLNNFGCLTVQRNSRKCLDIREDSSNGFWEMSDQRMSKKADKLTHSLSDPGMSSDSIYRNTN